MKSTTPKHWQDFDGTKEHLVSEFLDGDTELVVYKYWRPAKQRWQYAVEERWILERKWANKNDE